MDPLRFREELRHFDKRLDLIFNPVKSQWEIIGTDRKGIKYLIKAFPLGRIDQIGMYVLRELAEMATFRHGAKDINRKIDRMIEEEEATEQRQTKSTIEAVTSEAHAAFQRRVGRRISNVGVPYIVNDKRRVIA